LRRKIEGDGEAGLAFGEVLAVERVGIRSGRMPRIGAEDPRLVARSLVALSPVAQRLVALCFVAHRRSRITQAITRDRVFCNAAKSADPENQVISNRCPEIA